MGAAERELIAAYVSGLNRCRYCHGVHTATAELLGVEEGTLRHLIDALLTHARRRSEDNNRHEMKEKDTAFRGLHEEAGALDHPNPWDMGTARILAAMGLHALAAMSAGMAIFSSLGKTRCSSAVP